MARQALTIGGAIIGSFFGYPQLGFVIGSIVGNYVDPQVIKTPGIQELPVQTASEGGYRQVVYGTCWINQTNIIDFGDVRRVTRRERQGKGGGPVVESERLYRTYAIGLGEPLEAIRVIRRDGKIVYDVRPGSTILADSAKFAERFRLYTGAEDQLPDPDLEALPHNGVGNTPYYRGTAYLVFPNDDLTDVQGRIPTYEVEGLKRVGEFSYPVQLVADVRAYGGFRSSLAVADADIGLASQDDVLSVTPNGIYVAAASYNAGTTFEWFKYDTGTGVWSSLTVPVGAPTLISCLAWDTSGTYLALSTLSSGSNRLLIYKRTGDTLALITGPTNVETRGINFVTWTDDALIVAYGGSTSTQFGISAWSPESFGAMVNFGQTGLQAGLYASVSGNYMLGTCTNGVALFSLLGAPSLMDTVALADIVAATWDSTNGYGVAVTNPGVYTSGDNIVYSFTVDTAGSSLGTPVAVAEQPTSNSVDRPTSVSLSADRLYFAMATGEGYPTVYSLAAAGSPEKIANPATTGGTVTAVAWASTPSLPQYEATSAQLSAVLEDIEARCGLATAEIDMSALDAVLVDGVTLGGGYNGADAITLFMPAYFFDLVQPEKVLTAVPRGRASVAAVTASDFVEEPDENLLRGQDIEFLRVLMLKYLNPGQNYAAPAAVVSRTSPDVRVSGEATTDLPISFDESGALQVADRMLKVMWEDLNGEVTFALPSGPWAWLTPTDILTLSLRGCVYRIRVEKVEESAGVLKVTARRDRQSAYTSNLTAPSLPTPTPPPPALAGDTTFVVMNLPALVDGDDALGVYIAMTGGEDTAWSGAQVEYRVQGAADWTVLGTYTTRAVMGELLANLPAASTYYTDTTNPLSVSLVYTSDQLESLTYAQFLSEGNPFAIVNADFTAEIGQFRYALDDSSSDWTLTTLQRGRLNTTAGAHSAGDTFVMLDGAIFLPLPISVIGQTLEFRVTSIGNSPETAPTQTLVWVPQYSQYEFAPEFLSLERSGGTISGSWSPRHRFGTDVYPVASANFTGYQVTLTDGTVTNTFSTLDPEFSTSDAAYAGTITVTVAQTNRITGAGPSISESI